MMLRLPASLVCGVFSLLVATRAQGTSSTTSSSSYLSLATTTGAVSPDASVCCFVIQDVVTEIWAEQYYTSVTHSVVNLTSITIRITPGTDKTITNYETNVYTTNASFSFTIPDGQNPISLFNNNAPGPSQTEVLTYNSSQIVTAGVTIPSPAAAYVYTTVKVITAAPVTDVKGNVVCGTPFSFPTEVIVWDGNSTSTSTRTAGTARPQTIQNINFNAQAYWGTNILGLSSSAGPASVETDTATLLTYGSSFSSPTSTETVTQTVQPEATFFINSNFQSVNINTPKPSGVTISFITPFVYLPSTGLAGKTGEGENDCVFTTGTEGYGYPPQTLLDYMVSNSAISSQYPGLASCLAGGPSMILPTQCSAVAPHFVDPGGDLTDTTVIIVTPTLTAIPESTSQTIPVATTPQTTPPVPHTTSSVVVPPVNTSPATTPVKTSASPPNLTTSPSTPQNPTNPGPANPETSPNTPHNPTNPAPASAAPANPASSSAAAIASAIASGIGATPIGSPTTISGITDAVISSQVTSPLNPAASIAGNTVVPSGATNIIVSSATTVPLANVVSGLPGSTALVSGTLEVVFSGASTVPVNSKLPGLQGSTTVISGSSYVVISGPTTVPVVLGQPSPSAGGGSNLTAPLQASGGVPIGPMVKWEGVVLLGSILALVRL